MALAVPSSQGQGGHREDLTLVLVAHLLPLTPRSVGSALCLMPPRATDSIFLLHAPGKTIYHHNHRLSVAWVSWHPFPIAGLITAID